MKYCITFLFALNFYTVYGQKQTEALIDSILKELHAAADDTNKVNLLDRLSFTYATIDPNEGLRHGFGALALAEKLNWKKGQAVAYADIAVNYETRSSHDTALAYNLKALKLYEELKRKKSVAAIEGNIGLIYLARSNYPKALEYTFRALNTNEDINDKKSSAINMENIGTIYFEQKNFPRTIEYYTNALDINKTLADNEGIARNLGNLGIVLDAQGNYTRALKYHMMALNANENIGNKDVIQVNLANIGYVYGHMKDYNAALKYQFMALNLSREMGNKSSIAINLGNIGETYFAIATDSSKTIQKGIYIQGTKSANLLQSAQYLERAVTICEEIKFRGPLIEFNRYLSDAYFLSGNYKKALSSLRQYTSLKDSVFSVQNKMQIADLELKRETAIRDKNRLIQDKQARIKDLELTQKRNEHKLFIIGIILLLVLIGIAIRWIYISRRTNRHLQKEKEKHLMLIEEQINQIKTQTSVLREIADMQSHNVRGPVATILGLVQLFNTKDYTDRTNQVIIDGIKNVTEKLDEAIREVIAKENKLENEA